MLKSHRSFLGTVRDLFKRRRERNERRGRRPSLRIEALEPRWTMTHTPSDHIHPRLTIYINGSQVPIPANIGLTTSGTFANPHTHDTTGILHIGETMSGTTPGNGVPPANAGTGNTVRNVTVDDFFDVWRTAAGAAGNNANSLFDSTHILDKTVDATHTLKMYVNGVLNTQYENYSPEDGDDVVIVYESTVGSGVPDFAPIPTTQIGNTSPVMIPLDGSDPQDQNVTYTVSVANPALLQATMQPSTNKSMKISVANYGDMVFSLFNDKAPRVTSHMETLASQGLFNGKSFYRVVDGFMIQGGPGTGTSSLGKFDDQFHVDLQHNRRGILSMAKSTDDTNDTEFFITAEATRFLDYNHSVWGVLVEGDNVRQKINDVPTQAASSGGEVSVPTTPVTISSVSVFQDKQNGVLMLKGLGGTGETDVTVTARDSDGNTRSRTFRVFVQGDVANSGPFLNDINPVKTTVNTPATFTLTSQDVEGDAVTYTAVAAGSVASTVNVNATTGQVTVTPPTGFAGVLQVNVSVRAAAGVTNDTADKADGELVSVEVAPAAPTSVDLMSTSDSGFSNSDNITNQTTLLQFVVNGVTNGATVKLMDGNTVIGQGTASGTSVTITTTGALSEGTKNVTAVQAVGGVDSIASAALSVVIDTTAPVALTSTAPTEANVGTQLSYNAAHAEEGQTGFRYGLTNPPTGATIDPVTGILTWTPVSTQIGQQTFAVTATDAAGNARTQTLNISVADSKLVELRIAITDANGQALTSVPIGGEFFIRMFARDLRTNPGGPFGAYMDITYDSTKAERTSAAITYGNNFSTAKSGDTSTPGLIDELGASGANLSAIGSGDFLVAIVPMKAKASGAISIVGNAADVLPGHNVLVYNSDQAIPPARVTYGSATLNVQSAVTANTNTFNVNEDTTNNTFDVLANDVAPPGFTGQLLVTQVSTTDKGGTVAISQNGTRITYTPPANYTGADFFTYTVSAGTDSAQARVDVQVTNVNDPPVATADSFTVTQNSTSNVLDVLANDTDIDTPSGDKIKVTAVGATSNGGTVTIGPNGANINYKPANGYTGTDKFTYTITDNSGVTSTATATITVGSSNQAPTAAADTFTVTEDSAATTFTVLANDSLASGVTGTLSVTGVGTTNNGTVSVTSGGGSVTYTPKANFQGTDTFTYTLSDGAGHTSTGTVTVNVTNTNDNPSAVNDTLTALKNVSAQSLNVLANDSFAPDPQETLTIQSVTTGSAGGTLTVAADGKSVLYTPATDYTGTETFTYTINDGHGGTATATGTITVSNFRPSTLSGKVFIDGNDDGIMQSTDQPLAGVKIALTGTDSLNQTVNLTAVSGTDGSYTFTNLAPGTYKVKQSQLAFMRDGKDMAGSHGGSVTANDEITVTIAENSTATAYNFAELGKETKYIDLRDFIASRSRSYVVAAVNPTSGLAWSAAASGWSDTQIADIRFATNNTQLTITGTRTTTPSNGGTATTSNVSTTINVNDPKVMSLGTDGTNQLYKLVGASSAFNFQTVSSASGEGEGDGSLRVTSLAPGATDVSLASSSIPGYGVLTTIDSGSSNNGSGGSTVSGSSSNAAAVGNNAPRLVDAALSQREDSSEYSLVDFLASNARRTNQTDAVDAALQDPLLLQ